MAKKKPSVTLTVHQAVIDDSVPLNLTQILEAIRENLKPGDATLDKGLFDRLAVHFPSFPKTNEAIGMQLALHQLESRKTTVAANTKTVGYSTDVIAPPEESEFLDHEVTILVDGNTLIACNLSNRENMLTDAITRTAATCGIKIPPTGLRFIKPVNELTLEAIRSTGVKNIWFDAYKLLSRLGPTESKLFDSIFSQPSGAEELAKEEVIANIEIRSKRGRRSRVDVLDTPKSEFLQKTAELTWDDENVDSYTIVLDDGTEWPEGSLKLSKSVRIKSDGGSSYNKSEALQNMLDYLNFLKENGHLK